MSYESENFYNTFKAVMDELGLPCPKALWGTFEQALKSAGMLLAAYAVSPTSTLKEVLQTFPTAGSDAAIAKAALEVAATVSGYMAAAYVGACIGAMVVAAWDTYGPRSIGKLRLLIRDAEQAFGREFHQILRGLLSRQPGLQTATMQLAISRSALFSTPQR